MRTAEEMVQYVEENNLGSRMTKRWRLKHFKVAASQLRYDEEVVTCFIGMHNFISAANHNNYFAYIITQDRFIMAQKKMIGENLQIVSRKHFNDMHKSTGMI